MLKTSKGKHLYRHSTYQTILFMSNTYEICSLSQSDFRIYDHRKI